MNNKGSYMSGILRENRTVFTFKDILLLWRETDTDTAMARINYYVHKKELYPIRRGIYAKDKNYNRLELAMKICTPAYISFETVLLAQGVIFQHYDSIFIASYLSREIVCDNQKYIFKKIKNRVLTNVLGLEKKENYFIASKERAFLDTIYLNKNYYFDNLSSIDFGKCFELLPIYENKRMIKTVNSYFKSSKNA